MSPGSSCLPRNNRAKDHWSLLIQKDDLLSRLLLRVHFSCLVSGKECVCMYFVINDEPNIVMWKDPGTRPRLKCRQTNTLYTALVRRRRQPIQGPCRTSPSCGSALHGKYLAKPTMNIFKIRETIATTSASSPAVHPNSSSRRDST